MVVVVATVLVGFRLWVVVLQSPLSSKRRKSSVKQKLEVSVRNSVLLGVVVLFKPKLNEDSCTSLPLLGREKVDVVAGGSDDDDGGNSGVGRHCESG